MRYLPFVALAAIAGTVAFAQPPQGAPAAASPDRAARWQARKADMDARMATERKRRADDIALLIGLRADQRPAFDAMEAAMMPPRHGPSEGGPDGGKPPQDETMAARLDHMSARIDERTARAKAKLAALKTFYTGLSPEQKQRFDALDRLRHDHDRMGPHGGWGGRGRGGPGHDGPPPPPMG